MANESFLIKISIILSLLGICVLFLVSRHIEINDTTVSRINGGEESDQVRVRGIVVSARQSENAAFIVVEQTSRINAVLFANNVDVPIGSEVEILGKISDDKSFIVDSISIIK
ncbi:MAG: hypothetical protein ABIJ34_07800 [archaeon]